MSGTYRDLEVWQAAMKMVFDVYRDTVTFPKQEMFGLTSQLRRAAVSVASNIAEGKGRFSDRELRSIPFSRSRLGIRNRNSGGDRPGAGFLG
jgi:hypothetical protein